MQWKGLPLHEATWKGLSDFRCQFPLSQLEDKLTSEGGSTVRPPVIFTYERRGKKGKEIVSYGESSGTKDS